jgi:hypothetical protein
VLQCDSKLRHEAWHANRRGCVNKTLLIQTGIRLGLAQGHSLATFAIYDCFILKTKQIITKQKPEVKPTAE